MLKTMIGAALAVGMMTVGANAAVISATNASEITAPATVTNGSPGSNTEYLYFNEVQNYTLGSDLVTDQGTILAGTMVNSHMILLNRESGKSRLELTGTFTFDGDILGTISDIHGAARLVPSDYLGAPTTYTNFSNRGLESNDSFFFSGATLTTEFIVTQPGDWMRVVTAAEVPLPAGVVLLGSALAGMGVARRRKKQA